MESPQTIRIASDNSTEKAGFFGTAYNYVDAEGNAAGNSDLVTVSPIKTVNDVDISDAPRSFDGTRAADAGGDGIDGKLRVFLESDNSKNLSNGMGLIDDLRDKDVIESIQEKIKKNLSNSFIRIEYISDRKGFWIKPNLDIKEKRMTMMLFINTYDE